MKVLCKVPVAVVWSKQNYNVTTNSSEIPQSHFFYIRSAALELLHAKYGQIDRHNKANRRIFCSYWLRRHLKCNFIPLQTAPLII
jgi:hypothetical protein